MVFKSCRFLRNKNSLSNQLSPLSTPESEYMCTEGTLCTLSDRSGFLCRNPPYETQFTKQHHYCLPECRWDGLFLGLGAEKVCFSVCRVHQISPVRDFAAGTQSERGCVALVYNPSGRGCVVLVYEPVCMCVLVVCMRR